MTSDTLPEGWAWRAPEAVPDDFALDNWAWHALYADGTALQELDGDVRHRFAEIDQARLAWFVLRPLHPGLPTFGVPLGDDRRLIFYRLRRMTAGAELLGDELVIGPSTYTLSVQVLGFQRTLAVGGERRNVKTLTYVQPDGMSFTSDRPEYGDHPGD